MHTEFSDLFILDLANNHQGDINHAKAIIKEVSETVKKYNVKGAIKFQFRDLKNFVHHDCRKAGTDAMVDRFLTTALSDEQFIELKKYVESQGLLTACTPFDESSVKKVVDMGFDYIKIASASAQDWPLIEAVRETHIPLVVSTGGLCWEEIDKLVYFISKSRKAFALMHCVSVYPTPNELYNLGRISALQNTYPHLTIGWSTHESPNDYQTISIAYALGARSFEKHIGKKTEQYGLNQYSATKDNIDHWLHAYNEAKKKIITDENEFIEQQKTAIKKLVRGSFAKRNIQENETIEKEDVYYAFPSKGSGTNQLPGFGLLKTRSPIAKDDPIKLNDVVYEKTKEALVEEGILKLRLFLQERKYNAVHYDYIEMSFHKGLDSFYSVGCYFINFSNPPYIKKHVILLPGQSHPVHNHNNRSESFSVISGELTVTVEDKDIILREGQQKIIYAKQWHKFSTTTGVIFEENIYVENPVKSEYEDDVINNMNRSERVIRIEGNVL